MLTFEQAREQLEFHCGADPRVEDSRWQQGFLSMLRPYTGLRREVLANVDECVAAVAQHLRKSETLDRQVINSLWGIVHFGRAWAISKSGMLQRNHLISAKDRETLETWLEELSLRIAMLLDGNSAE